MGICVGLDIMEMYSMYNEMCGLLCEDILQFSIFKQL